MIVLFKVNYSEDKVERGVDGADGGGSSCCSCSCTGCVSSNECCFYVVTNSRICGRESNLSSHEVMKLIVSNVSAQANAELVSNNLTVTESSTIHCNENVIYKLTLDSVSKNLKNEIFRVVKRIEKVSA